MNLAPEEQKLHSELLDTDDCAQHNDTALGQIASLQAGSLQCQ